ncbi:NAD-dependent succinate-semialdehyde dehydrogenase [Jiulongibacter sediminis]|uniref:Succinate-semialdehyde dehydrogenase n=1 Tax=Jiulongibacter sediminis TaxID=1605367 RepID=A0A0N8H9V4_9BACT|nr:NAD-dependent succinate-semialdehyde dehydrogenase [Jiulongibacter sediminis]KPM48420.1 succinate-semialdehyde dehydrogenase [Jiulongibacter sediminis]TBX24961.1 succinate-semialdehyde dehydrogenase [Jiulongibacter sediminis]
MTIESVNPANNKKLQEYTLLTDEQAERKLKQSEQVYKIWRKTGFSERSKLMLKAADVLNTNKEKYALMMTREMGKTLASSRAEVEKCAWVCRYYAENAETFLHDEKIQTDASRSYVSYQPLGVILAVMPWNFPFWQVFRFAAPALMAGNAAVLKHASNVPGSAALIQEVFDEAGFPKGLFTNLWISSKQVEKLIENPIIKAVTLTGSEKAGASVAAKAAQHIKKAVLELGGSDAYIILEDADLDLAAKQCTESRLLNTGQSCIGAKRFIVLDEVYEEFLLKFIEQMLESVTGDPEKEETTMGPMARTDLRDELHEQVMKSVEKGAEIQIGGEIQDLTGAYYPATILTNVKPGMPAYEEELFGPVASVIKVKDEAEAIQVANDSKFGLGSGVFTKDLSRGERIARYELEAGSSFVNQYVKSDPRLPFGGIKTSGFGRELSHHGILEFVNTKTIYIA